MVLRMADLPSAHLRLLKPSFFSMGVDCFGPYMVKLGRSDFWEVGRSDFSLNSDALGDYFQMSHSAVRTSGSAHQPRLRRFPLGIETVHHAERHPL